MQSDEFNPAAEITDVYKRQGQGSAFVGILDAFMESKGITTPEEWRQWCSPVVPFLGRSDSLTLHKRIEDAYESTSLTGIILNIEQLEARHIPG